MVAVAVAVAERLVVARPAAAAAEAVVWMGSAVASLVEVRVAGVETLTTSAAAGSWYCFWIINTTI